MKVLIGLLISLFGAIPQSPGPGEADEILAQLSKIRLDKKQIHNIRDVTIRRDVLSISLTRGAIAFLEPVMGKVTGAVFIGTGEIVAIPPDAIEKQQLHRFTGTPILNEPFKAVLFRFTDDTFEEITREIADRAQEEISVEDLAQFDQWEAIINQRSGGVNFRIVADLLDSSKRPLFLGTIEGDRTGRFEVLFDSQLAEEVTVFKVPDVWASFNQRSQARNPEAVAHEAKAPFDVIAYDIEGIITSDYQIDAKAFVRLKGVIDGPRVLTFELARELMPSGVFTDGNQAIPFYRYPAGNTMAVVLPQPLTAGREVTLRFAYAGNASRRQHWYPDVVWADRADFNIALDNYKASLKQVLFAGLFLSNTATRPANESDPVRNYFSQILGVFPFDDLKLIQSAGNEIRSWPGFVELPGFDEMTIAQEVARQWFGHSVAPASYRDEWLLEGLARYLALMYIDSIDPQSMKFREILEGDRSAAIANDPAGAISLGPRLVSTFAPNGYRGVQAKASWVLHMIRTLMKDDASFLAMLREVAGTHRGKSISSWDFKRLTEKHAGQDLDWFFSQWVFGTGIPAFSLDYKVEGAGNKFVVYGSLRQADVPDGFAMPVPLYADDQLLGRVSTGDNEGEFQFAVSKKPERIVIDPGRTILSK